jgi:hypothetical protein
MGTVRLKNTLFLNTNTGPLEAAEMLASSQSFPAGFFEHPREGDLGVRGGERERPGHHTLVHQWPYSAQPPYLADTRIPQGAFKQTSWRFDQVSVTGLTKGHGPDCARPPDRRYFDLERKWP